MSQNSDPYLVNIQIPRLLIYYRTNLFVGTFTGPFVQVDIGLLQHNVGETSADTLDGGHGEHDFALAIDVGAEDTQNVLEFLGDDQRLKNTGKPTTTINVRIRDDCLPSTTTNAIGFGKTGRFHGYRAKPPAVSVESDGDPNG